MFVNLEQNVIIESQIFVLIHSIPTSTIPSFDHHHLW